MKRYFDQKMKRDICEEEFDGRVFRFPAVFANRYEASGILAAGGFGALLIARDKKIFDRKVLVKLPLLDEHLFLHQRNTALNNAVSEAQARTEFEKKMLLHGHLRGISGIPTLIDWIEDVWPQVYGPHKDSNGVEFFVTDSGLYEKMTFLVMSFIDGAELDTHLQDFIPIKKKPAETLKFIAVTLAKTLQAFHQKEPFGSHTLHFIYQDLKPANILGIKYGGYFLVDFGSFAVVFDDLTPQNTGIGTDGYKAPEADSGEQFINPQLDVFSLGKTLLECWDALNNINHIPSGKRDQLKDLPQKLPSSWKVFLDRCIETDVAKRWKDMDAVIPELNKLR
ncbi:MAG: hypothetical protein HQM09_22155 [Candidatus Riflebacteria bacterium]|nr:hypothetical protein [Candidatus Riflebacteria bacterium]